MQNAARRQFFAAASPKRIPFISVNDFCESAWPQRANPFWCSLVE
jgi:hypothetical protein